MPSRRTLATLLLALAACGDNKDPVTSPDGGPEPDAGPIEVPLDRVQAGGSPEEVVVIGTRAYVGVGPRLTIWDLTSANGAEMIGESAPLRGIVDAIEVIGDRAYVAERTDLDSMLHIFDISNPAAPVETAALSVAEGKYSVIRDLEAGEGATLYVADQEQGVVELSLADPDAPTKVRVGNAFGVTGLQLVGDRLYTIGAGFTGAGYSVLDLEDELAELGGGGLGNVNGVAFSGNLVITAGPDGISVLDLTDPTAPVERYAFGEPDQGPFSRAVAVRGTTAYVPAEDGLHVLDLSTPTAITRTGPHDALTPNANAADAAGDKLAIVTDRGRMLTYEITTPTQPTGGRVVDVTLCTDCIGVAVKDATVYLADIVGGVRSGTLADLRTIARSPALPLLPDTGGLQFVFEDVQVAGDHVYVADWLFGLRIYDATTPSAITPVGATASGGMPGAVAIAGTTAFLAEGTNGGAIKAFDVSTPALPSFIGGHGTSKAMDVDVRDGVAYVADEAFNGDDGGLRMFDVRVLTDMKPLGVYSEDCASAGNVSLAGNLAILACGFDGFHIVDISDPLAPTRVARISMPEHGQAWATAAYEGHAVLGHDFGVLVVSLATPSSPQTVASYTTATAVRALAVPSPGRIVAATGLSGVYQWKVD